MLVDQDLADVPLVEGQFRQVIPYVPEDPDNPEIDPDTGLPKAEDYIQHSPAIEDVWDEADLAAIGWYKLHTDPRPSGVRITGREREWRDVGGVQQAWEKWLTEPYPATAEAVDRELGRLLAESAPITIGERSFRVQTRGESDLLNILGRVEKANQVVARGGDKQFLYRDEANVMQPLTPAEMVDVGDQVFDHRERLAFASYQVKAQIEDGTVVNADDIGPAFQAVLSAAP